MFSFDLAAHSAALLLVEDEPVAREWIVTILRRRFPTLEVLTACDGAEGLELYRRHRPDLVITDINMPRMNGITMAREILAEAPAAHIIVTSGHSDTHLLLEAIKLGIRSYVLKPLDCKLLFEAVAECLAKAGLQRQVRRQEQYITLLSQTVEQSSSLVAIADRCGSIVYVNGRFSEQTGFTAEEGVGMHLRQLHGAEGECFEEIWSRISAGCEWHGECLSRKKDGAPYWEAASIAPLHDADGNISHFVTVRQDITTRKRSQEELERVQRLEALGGLAGGIAHDFNNILTAVLGNVSLAQQIDDADQRRCVLEEAEKASHRAAALARKLLTFAHGGKPVKKPVRLAELLDEALALAQGRAHLRGRVQLPAGIHALEVDREQICQAFTNILVNAADAMPGGEVLVEGENVELSADNLFSVEPGAYLRVSFTDAGCGIPQGQLQKIFEPYFSTKPGATGLGLASTHSVITRHGGHIAVESAAGKGTTFVCYLPSTGSVSQEAERPMVSLSEETSAGGSVLIMDDESVVRKVTGKMLECLGYRVTVCNRGEDAVALYRKHQKAGTPFLVVIMDLNVVGGMGGKEAARHILASDPNARLVVSSGYYDDPVLADYQDYGFCAMLPKPYKSSDLAQLMSGLSRSTGMLRAS